MAVSGADSNRVYAIVENDNGGLFRSDDAGATWTLVNGGRNIRQRAFYYTHVDGRSAQQGRGLRAERRHVQVDRRRQDADVVSPAATRTTCGSIPTTRTTSCTRATAAARSPTTR